MDMRAPYVFLLVHVCRRASGSGGSVLAAMQLEWPRCDSRERSGGEREREESARVCAGHGTRCNDDGGGDFNGEGEGEKERGQREGGRKKDRLG